jgi:Flp pilus assembly protein TadG
MKPRRHIARTSVKKSRRAAVVVLVALLIVFLLGMVAFGVDIGYIVLVRTQLQAAADSAAMAAVVEMVNDPDNTYSMAQSYASKHWAGGEDVALETADVQIGSWDSEAKTFTPSASSTSGNAVKVTARRSSVPLFFGAVLGKREFDTEASAVAMANPRDICFVVDLSGSMNDDTETAWVSDYQNTLYAGQGYGNVGSELMQKVYDDFGYGTYPGTLEYLGSTLGVTSNSSAYANMTANNGPLTTSSIPSAYRISSTDSESTRKRKCYSWLMDVRFPVIMPGVQPTPNSANSTSYAYWERYIDYLILQSSAGTRGTIPSLTSTTYRITGLNNPNDDSYPSISSSVPQGYRNKFGFRTYVNFMMDYGRDVKPGNTMYTPLSTSSSLCPYHSEEVGDKTFSFPPREQPTHASRRSIIAAIQVVEEQNEAIANLNVRDWVSIVTFDHLQSGGPVIRQTLTGDYDAAMQACTTMQAVCDDKSSTATESGLIKARDHLKPAAAGNSVAAGRKNTNKVIVLLTDGVPNLYSSSNSAINSFISANSNSDWYGSSSYAKNAPLMQAMKTQLDGWYMYPVGLGLGTDYTFMDRMARMGQTADGNGEAFRSSGNPTLYEEVLKDIFEQIIRTPRARLVQ